MTARLLPFRRVAGNALELTDDALVAACATGDAAALGALFDRFNVSVYRFISRLRTVDEAARDDIVQATFLALPRIAQQFRGASSVKTWILGITANIARHHRRSEERRRLHDEHFSQRSLAVVNQPDAEFERRQVLAAIAKALETLPYDQQVAFVLCDLEQIPGVDVARALDIPEGTLWRRLHVARKAVRTAIERKQS